MIFGGLEIILGKAILGKVFASAAAKTVVGAAAKGLVVHDAINVADSLSSASDAASASQPMDPETLKWLRKRVFE